MTQVQVVRKDRTWAWILVIGGAVWLASALVSVVTHNLILVPTVILVGSFLVPFAVLSWALTLPRDGELTHRLLLVSFCVGGTFGLVAAAAVETWVLPQRNAVNLTVGVIEEASKALIVLLAARRVTRRGRRDGMLLGAVVGAGFATFESAGYAFNTLVEHADDRPMVNVLETEMSRALLSPFGHILWTALMGGAIFAGVHVWRTYAGISVLHGAWNASYGVAIIVTTGLMGDGWHWTWPDQVAWVGSPVGGELLLFNIVYDVLLGIVALVGVVWVTRAWRLTRAPDGADHG